MDTQKLEISFDNCSPAEAALLVQRLEADLRDTDPTGTFDRKKERTDTQDFGTTLILIFGTPVAIALAKSLGIFLQRNSGSSITIKRNGEVVARNLDSKDAARIAEAFANKRQ
jgi:hypothetical protein